MYWNFYDDDIITVTSLVLRTRPQSSMTTTMMMMVCAVWQLFEVRQSICVTGVNRDAVLKVKGLVAGVTSEPLPLESFHVKQRSDVADGAMLVPKIVLAAAHCPGQRFIGQTSASDGQLDFLYDEVCNIGGKVDDVFCTIVQSFSKCKK